MKVVLKVAFALIIVLIAVLVMGQDSCSTGTEYALAVESGFYYSMRIADGEGVDYL
jgi:hypothetical protein